MKAQAKLDRVVNGSLPDFGDMDNLLYLSKKSLLGFFFFYLWKEKCQYFTQMETNHANMVFKLFKVKR